MDNRLALWLRVGQTAAIPPTLLNIEFYGRPVVLETEPDLGYVGSSVHIVGLSVEVSYNVPGFAQVAFELGFDSGLDFGSFANERWRYRTCVTQVWSLRAGVETRLYGAVRQSFPISRAQCAVLQVFSICVYLYYPSSLLTPLLRKHARKFPVVYSMIFGLVRSSVFRGGPQGAINLVEEALRLHPVL